MWKNIKRKWQQIFDDDTKEEKRESSSINSISSKTVETKMTYKYPKTAINFSREKNKKDALRHYEKRKPRIEKTLQPPRYEKKDNDNKEKPKIQQPFKAREVPSPVHGYRPLPERNKLVFQQDKIYSKPITEHNEFSKEVHKQADIQEVQKIPEKPANTRFQEISNKEEQTKKKTKPVHIEEKRKMKNNKPTNVMMTPRDKRNQLDQRNRKSTIKQAIPTYLFNDKTIQNNNQTEWVKEQKDKLQTTLRYFNIKAKVVDATQGPTVTRFEIQPEPGVKVSKIKNLSDDIKLNLAARDIRMEAPIPGRTTIGIEVPNAEAKPVVLQSILDNSIFSNKASSLTVALGLDIEGEAIVTDISKMPHGLIAGATWSGKSVCINTILISLLYKANYDEVKLLLIDPKMVELTPYNEIPHLVAPVITDVKAATSSLKWAVREMEDRYQKFVTEKTRDINKYNEKMKKLGRDDEHLPYIVIVIDELADLMMSSPQDVEDAICRIAQKARACGIHLLIATQRPSVDVITGLIKANIPSRIAFSVSSQVDSRTILDTNGAEKLLGKGDMLFVENGSSETKRIQGAFVSDEEIERITNYVKQLAKPNYLFEQEQLIEQIDFQEDSDELYEEAIQFVLEYNGASASLLQRKFKIGYNRAARLVDMMEEKGIVSGQNGSKPREILISQHDLV